MKPEDLVVGKLYRLKKRCRCSPYGGETTYEQVKHLYNKVSMNVVCEEGAHLLYLGKLMTIYIKDLDGHTPETLHLFLNSDGRTAGAWESISFDFDMDIEYVDIEPETTPDEK